MQKKILFVAIAAVLVLGMFLFSCGNQQEKVVEVEEIEEVVVEDTIIEDPDSFVWFFENDTAFIYGNCKMPEFKFMGLGRVHIFEDMSDVRDSIRVVVIENTVTHIRKAPFMECSKLECIIYRDNIIKDWWNWEKYGFDK